jgi:hypothetical protein
MVMHPGCNKPASLCTPPMLFCLRRGRCAPTDHAPLFFLHARIPAAAHAVAPKTPCPPPRPHRPKSVVRCRAHRRRHSRPRWAARKPWLALSADCMSSRRVMVFPPATTPVTRKCVGMLEMGIDDISQRKVSFSGAIQLLCGDGGWSAADVNRSCLLTRKASPIAKGFSILECPS